jgi:hypothetical protein
MPYVNTPAALMCKEPPSSNVLQLSTSSDQNTIMHPISLFFYRLQPLQILYTIMHVEVYPKMNV